MAGARSKTRKRALQILFEADQRGVDPVTILADWVGRFRADKAEPQVAEYTMRLVEGVQEHRKRIDDLIGTYAVGWTLDRMPGVDRNVLRLGIYELLWESDVPDVVAIDEAVELAKEYSTDESPAFVNGLLARIKDLKPTLLR
ncbi:MULTISPECIES: transcription antitermination factor NusB [Embleya]|uniref:Transcription antitermination protein NusB n=2 Tax=Embleya TaxID=2699295 RepID=A0A1T3NTR6_9ACTN|nr:MULTISPECIES: transcription antitermination factor NusB [Embleya]OPC80145.1 N utilization substance protein B [Embleya scabrispora]GCE01773.1 N utilization substance protein B homolog [Embleya hyalina]